ncbi:MAG: zinc ABC transporter substrate-binding protein [Candidatus Hydrogenedentes bacterium]|nr:zinc ABC transporter substrate-binding protein [Candidatus Hydrogenedentota bacterium]
MRWHSATLGVALCATALGAAPRSDAALKVVTTLSTFADLAKSVGGDHVAVSSVAAPQFNPHFIEPKPSDILRVKKADLFIHAGLDLEVWRGPLVDAAGNPQIRPGGAKELDVSRGVPLLEVPDNTVTRAQGDIHAYGNPHYWLEPENGRRIARTIAAKLEEIDAANAVDYAKNLAGFEARLDAKLPEWKAAMVPHAGTEIIGYHNEWPYLMQFLGLKMDKFLEPKPGIPPTPKRTEFLEQYMKQNNVKIIAQAAYFPTKASDALAQRTGGHVVMLSQSVGDQKAATDYLAMVDYNVGALVAALQQH